MAENAIKIFNSVHLKQNSKVIPKKGPLSVINGDISTRKRSNNARKLNCKSQNQENSGNNPHILNAKKIPTFEKENEKVMKFKWNYPSQKQDDLKNKQHVPDTQSYSVFGLDNDVVIDLTTDENCLPSSTIEILCDDESLSATSQFAQTSTARSSEYNKILSDVEDLNSLHNKKNDERRISEYVWCTPYRHDIYLYFKNIEKNFRPNPNYMEKQPDITMNMRSVLIDWFIEVGEEYKLQIETLHLAVSYVDRFLSHMSVLRGKLQLVGTASMFLAAKFEEIYPPELSDFVYITDDTYTKKQILRMEHLILKVLNFDVSVPTANAFLQLYCSMCNATEQVMYLSQYICELSLLDGDPFLKFTPSTIAAGSVALANYILGFEMWDKNIVESSGYKLSDIMHVIICLFNKYSGMSTCAHQAIYEKYKSPKYSAVATIKHPDNLTFPENSSKRFCYI